MPRCPRLQQIGSSDDPPFRCKIVRSSALSNVLCTVSGSRSNLRVTPVRLGSCTRTRCEICPVPHALSCRMTCNIRNGINSYVARLAIDGVQGDTSSRLWTSDSGLCSFEHPTCGSPECETNQLPRTRSPFFACTLCSRGDSMRLDGPGRDRTSCWFKLAFLSCITAVLSSEVQGCSRKTKDDHRIAHETNTCVVSVNFQHDSHFQRDRRDNNNGNGMSVLRHDGSASSALHRGSRIPACAPQSFGRQTQLQIA